MEQSIEFLTEDTDFQINDTDHIGGWIRLIAGKHKRTVKHLTIIVCSDEYLLKMNQEHLNHDFYTDVITFPYGPEGSNEIIGDIFVSIDRVRENAENFGVNYIDELHRVIIHGVLHLIGFDDKDEVSQTRMRNEEELALNLRMF